MINRQQMLKHGYVFDNKLFKQIILINFNNDIEAIGVSNWIYTNVIVNLKIIHAGEINFD